MRGYYERDTTIDEDRDGVENRRDGERVKGGRRRMPILKGSDVGLVELST